MKHNILKRTFAAGLAVLCIVAYAPAVLRPPRVGGLFLCILPLKASHDKIASRGAVGVAFFSLMCYNICVYSFNINRKEKK